MNILELGNYIAPAYAGMVLAEQGHNVVKWVKPGADPILSLRRGAELWDWINAGKTLEARDINSGSIHGCWRFDAVIDNFKLSTLERWGIDPQELAAQYDLKWVSLRSEVGEISFDLLAQCRSILEYSPWVPFYLGDTTAGLWMAFKVLAAQRAGHYVLGHASCLQKLVEGELVIDVKRSDKAVPWDIEDYGFESGHAVIEYRGEQIVEPVRDRDWKLKHLWHIEGRIVI